ncbi:MAG TPA: type I glyceraldehyde-3-phosphate dehydrogenase [Bacillota bacterium]|nr:type I glyceraldehyde-3-phosphate dehydrogenase [Bacillota bacterium]HQC36086.1 type I glyceraldehyde-3-phosphate dehydrogenase [Bacillota bacterium]
MSVKIGINGFGRIGRVAIRQIEQLGDKFEISAINYRNVDLNYMVYMLRYDTLFGRFSGTLDVYENGLVINGKKVPVYDEDVSKINWGEVGADYVIDTTGVYTTTEKCREHLDAGAKKVIISAPAKDKITPSFVYGVNHEIYNSDMKVVSGASCTTNCLAPMCKVLQDNFGIKEGFMSTIHSSTSKQKPVDSRSMKDWRVGRSIYGNIIPSTTGAAKAVGLVIPELLGKMTGNSYRIPTADVSVVDLNVVLETPTSLEEINARIKEASETYLKDVIEFVDDEVVSTDFLGSWYPCCYDLRQGIALNDHFFKLVAFYDNEWGYTANLLRLIAYMAEVDAK